MKPLFSPRLLVGLSLLFLVSSHRLCYWLGLPALVQSVVLALSVGLLTCELLCLSRRTHHRPRLR